MKRINKYCIKILLLVIFLLFTVSFTRDEVRADEETNFIVIPKVYAYTPPQKLLSNVDELIEEYDNIVIGIMPVYENTDYPALEEFIEVILYAQARGCRILLHFPLVQNEPSDGQIREAVLGAKEFYEENGIDIRGILLDDDSLEYEDVIYDENVFVINRENVEYVYKKGNEYEATPMLRTSKLPAKAYVYEPREVNFDYDYKRGVIDNISYDLEGQNKVLMVIVLVAIIIFLLMIIYARRLNRRRFLFKEDKDDIN